MKFTKYYYFIDWYITKDKASNFMAARIIMNYILTAWENRDKEYNYIKLSTSFIKVYVNINNSTIEKSLKNLSELKLITIISKPHCPRKVVVNEPLIEKIKSDYSSYISDVFDNIKE